MQEAPHPAAPLTACRDRDSSDARGAATLSRRERVFHTVPPSVQQVCTRHSVGPAGGAAIHTGENGSDVRRTGEDRASVTGCQFPQDAETAPHFLSTAIATIR